MTLNRKQIEIDLEKISLLSKRKENENFKFRTFLKGQDSGKVDRIVHRLNKEITDIIDCTECGNCCKELRPDVTEKEISILSAIDNIPKAKYIEEFTERDDFDKIKYLKNIPCKYLKDKKCSVYSDRPNDCRSYPHTHKAGFISRTIGMINNYGICPIVFNLFEELKIELRFR